MIVAMLAAVMLPLAAVASASWVHEWIWTPFRLVQSCKRQGIAGFTVFQASHWAKNDFALSWRLLNSVQKHGQIFYMRFGKYVRLIVHDAAFIQQVLVQNADCYEKPSFVTALQILGAGLFSASGNGWERQRQLFGQSFLLKELKNHFQAIGRYTAEEMESWNESLSKKDEIDIHKRFLGLTVKLIGHIAFGENIETNAVPDIYKRFDRYLHNYKSLLCNPCFNFPGYSIFHRQKRKQIMEDEKDLLILMKGFLKKRKSQVSSLPEGVKQELLLDLMIKSECRSKDFNEKLMLDNIATILLAGHETTASLLTWTVYLLAIHPLWQERARAEISHMLKVQELDWKQMSQLKTLNMILWESLRLFPPQSFIGRSCVLENRVQNIVIPKKMEVIVPVSSLHRDKQLWGEDADEFRPSRFANGINKASKNPVSFLPFGLGPRTCIGQSLALLEARIILSSMIQKYTWELSPDYQHCPDVTLTLQPKFGMPIILEHARQ